MADRLQKMLPQQLVKVLHDMKSVEVSGIPGSHIGSAIVYSMRLSDHEKIDYTVLEL